MRRFRQAMIDPENIFLDSQNIAEFDTAHFEGRVEKPVSPASLYAIGVVFLLAAALFSYKMFDLQIVQGAQYALAAQENRLAYSLVFAERGILYDRTGDELAWNEPGESFARRAYSALPGLAHVLGYVQYPKADGAGLWWRTEYSGIAGAEKAFDRELSGANGKEMVEVDAHGTISRGHVVEDPRDGASVHLSIDADVQSKLHTTMAAHAINNRFQGGAAVIMDVRTGEILALTSFPEFTSQPLVDGDSAQVAAYANDPAKPFLDRAISGVYTPGSIVKPLFAAAALAEGIISPDESIFSPGYITIPNPYHPELPTIMKDWRAHGWTAMREAIQVSSDVYFYAIGGGYEDQKGLGITKLDEYAARFGLGKETGVPLEGEVVGTIPTPAWKKEVFGEDEEWRLGDTYNTSIGQYGFQVTPIQMARAIAAIANGGQLLTPQLHASSSPQGHDIGITPAHLKIIREGMRQAVTGGTGTARALNIPGIVIAGKTGTAELGSRKQYMNSWVVGFWPEEDPHYSFAVVLEHAPAGTLSGASPGMRPFFEWLVAEKPEYLE
ncbi:MAG: hypothetical protein KBE09_04190 [Candidatus Pacebacteria bacterium]|nr:hypothetical protein [Candidatus Paceibacterota bacterium]